MEPLSGAASVIAVVSLVVQVSDSIKKLNDFRLSVKNAPQDIVQLSDQLVVLEDILKAVSRKIQAANGLQSLEVDASHPLYGAMRICQNVASELKQVVGYLETRYQRRGGKNLRTSVVAGWKKGRIKELKDRLDFACKVLLLQGTLGCSSWQVEKVSVAVYGSVVESPQQSQAETDTTHSEIPQNPSLAVIPSTIPPVKHKGVGIFSSPNNTFKSTVRNRRTILRERTWSSRFGFLRIRTYINRYDLSSDQILESTSRQTFSSEETEFRFVPTWGSNGLQLWTSSSSNRWIPASLRSSFIIPDNSKIFELCRDTKCDNTSEVLQEFSQGRASPFDTNSLGETLLHAAAFACNPVLCKALLISGANPSALDCLGKSPLEHAACGFPDYSYQVQTCRALEIEGQMDPWDLLVTEGPDPALRWRWRSYVGGNLCHWILTHDKPWFNIQSRDSRGATLLDLAFQFWILEVSSRPMKKCEWVGPMKWLIRAGGDIHLRGDLQYETWAWMMHYTENFETLARHWFDILRDCGVDVVRYFEQEKARYENATFFIRGRCYSEGFRACLDFPTEPFDVRIFTMKYVLPPTFDYEAHPLFGVFKDILCCSDSGFQLLLNDMSAVYQTPFYKERDKEFIRERREREGKPVSMVRRRRKLLARLHTSWNHVSHARSEAKRALAAEYAQSFQQGKLLPRGHNRVKILCGKGLHATSFDERLKLRSLYAWAFFLILAVSLGVNALLFRLWMSS